MDREGYSLVGGVLWPVTPAQQCSNGRLCVCVSVCGDRVLLKVSSYCRENMICDVEHLQTICVDETGFLSQLHFVINIIINSGGDDERFIRGSARCDLAAPIGDNF